MEQEGGVVSRIQKCPFCGSEADVYTTYERYDSYHVKCDRCHARTGWYRTDKEAIKAWNRRVS